MSLNLVGRVPRNAMSALLPDVCTAAIAWPFSTAPAKYSTFPNPTVCSADSIAGPPCAPSSNRKYESLLLWMRSSRRCKPSQF